MHVIHEFHIGCVMYIPREGWDVFAELVSVRCYPDEERDCLLWGAGLLD